ncbi:MAG: chorismate lyase [Gammaproteobacteria bacterium]|nr:chorismate lyase [Gammaproteobacteria bacterium]
MSSVHEPDWQASDVATPPAALRDWLLEPGSLTQRIREHCESGFHLDVLREAVAREEEIPAAWSAGGFPPRLREVMLNCSDTPLVFARTLIPDPATVNDRWLLELGDRPLGDVLFQSGGEREDGFELAQLDGSTELGRAALAHVESGKVDVTTVWARRSWVRLHGEKLLICECFLPGLT